MLLQLASLAESLNGGSKRFVRSFGPFKDYGPFWGPNIIRHLALRVSKKGP